MIWSPLLASESKDVEIAAIPVERARADGPSSRAAIFSSSAAWVGFATLE